MSPDARSPAAPPVRRLLAFTGWNLFGLCTPMVVAFFALPPLRHRMGADSYGAFMFLLTVINYLTILDMGLGRAVTQSMSARLASGRSGELPAIFWTAVAMMLGFAAAGMAVFFPMVPALAGHWSRIPPSLQWDAAQTLFAAGLGTPFLVLTACLVGVLEAHQQFKLINLIRLPMQTYTFLGPLAVALVTHSLLAPVVALLAGKILECTLYYTACLWKVPALRHGPGRSIPGGVGLADRGRLIRMLFSLSGWMSVSSIAMLVLNQVNSVLMFALLPVAMVGFYATIAEMIIRLLIFPRAWVSVLFPSFSAQHAAQAGGLDGLYARGIKGLLLVSFPVILVLFAFAGEGLMIWQDAAFATASAGVMRWLAAGIFVYSLSFVPLALLQGVGRPDLGARVHLVLIPLSIGVAWVLMKRFGLEGAGMAWFIRCVCETVAMTLLARRFAPGADPVLGRAALLLIGALALMAGVAFIVPLLARLAAVVAGGVFILVLGWRWLLNRDEQAALAALTGRMRRSA